VGAYPIPRKRLTVERLASAIHRAVPDAGMSARARRLGELLRSEDGVAHAVEVIEADVGRG
jgi:sterol 3beta-glucosyltransferase